MFKIRFKIDLRVSQKLLKVGKYLWTGYYNTVKGAPLQILIPRKKSDDIRFFTPPKVATLTLDEFIYLYHVLLIISFNWIYAI